MVRPLCAALLIGYLSLPLLLGAQVSSGFNGTWREHRETKPGRTARAPKQAIVALDGDKLKVNWTGPGKVPAVEVTFQIGGPEVTYTGLDGDEFHLRATREGDRLVFDGHEHERGHDKPLHEVWSFKDESQGRVLVITREQKGDTDEPSKSVAEYERVS